MHVLDSAWDALKREFESASLEKQRTARREATGELNRIFRRFRQYENEEQWLGALRDGAALAAREFAIFTVAGDELRLRVRQNLGSEDTPSISISSAAAFRSAVQSLEPVVTLRRANEVGAALAQETNARAHVLPVSNRGRAVAVLFAAEDEWLDMDGLELITGMASAVLERHANQSLHAQITSLPGAAADAEKARKPVALPPWSALSESDRRLHARAQRFSRVAVAEMQLGRPEACRAGREQNVIYLFLQAEIDRARESYRRQFMTIPSMVDYLHLELVQTAAEGDERKLGAEYPGSLA